MLSVCVFACVCVRVCVYVCVCVCVCVCVRSRVRFLLTNTVDPRFDLALAQIDSDVLIWKMVRDDGSAINDKEVEAALKPYRQLHWLVIRPPLGLDAEKKYKFSTALTAQLHESNYKKTADTIEEAVVNQSALLEHVGYIGWRLQRCPTIGGTISQVVLVCVLPQ